VKDQGSDAVDYFCLGKQVALFVALRHKASGKMLIAATTHIACAFTTPAKQIAQVQILLQQLHSFQTTMTVANGGVEPMVVLTGDYNSEPDSGAIQLIKSGTLPVTHPHCTVDEEDVRFPFEALSSAVPLRSAYESVLGAEPNFTNVTADYQGTLDYIFSNQGLVPLSVLGLPSLSECREEAGLPSSKHPSDHLPIAATFKIADL
jgi:CCR4-NOT transcription complex subunit 6